MFRKFVVIFLVFKSKIIIFSSPLTPSIYTNTTLAQPRNVRPRVLLAHIIDDKQVNIIRYQSGEHMTLSLLVVNKIHEPIQKKRTTGYDHITKRNGIE